MTLSNTPHLAHARRFRLADHADVRVVALGSRDVSRFRAIVGALDAYNLLGGIRR